MKKKAKKRRAQKLLEGDAVIESGAHTFGKPKGEWWRPVLDDALKTGKPVLIRGGKRTKRDEG